MLKWIALFFKNLFGEGIARALGGAGLTLATGAVIIPVVTGALNLAAQAVGGMPGDMLAVCLLGGLGEAISFLGSAMLTRIGMNATRVGIKRAAR